MSASEGGPGAGELPADDRPPLPLVFEGYEVADLLGWERRRALRFLEDLAIVERRAGRRCVSREALERALPEVLREARRRLARGLPVVTKARPRGPRVFQSM
jgi:hypothetical protein